jgi:hypothetical protein
VPQLDDLERPLQHRVRVAGGDRRRVVVGIEDQHQAAVEARPHQVDGLPAAGGGQVDDHGVDALGGHVRPGLDVQELGDPAGAVEQRSKGETQRGVTPEEHDVAGHPMVPTWW